MKYLVAYYLDGELARMRDAITSIDEDALLILSSAWIVSSNLTRQAIQDKLDRVLGPKSRLVVCAVSLTELSVLGIELSAELK